MKRSNPQLNKLILVATLMTVAIAFGPHSYRPMQAQSQEELQEFVRGEIIAEIKQGASIEEVNARNRTETIEQLRGTNFYRLRIPGNKREKKWRKRLERDPDVLIASLNPLVTTVFGRSVMSYPDGHPQFDHTQAEYLAQRERISQLRLTDAHLRSRGEDVVVAVIDTGVDSTHPDLASHMWRDTRAHADIAGDGKDNNNDGFKDETRGWDFIGNDNDPMDEPGDPQTTVAGHGTFIAGLIALAAPDARIMPIRAFRPDGRSNVFYVAAGIKFGADHGARVINLSCGTTEDSRLLNDAIKYAREQGVVVVAAAGNQGTSENPQYPASYAEEVIGVAAVYQNDELTYFSNYGPGVSVDALGYKLISSYPGGGYAEWSGTSFAAPLVSAAAALILEADDDTAKARGFIEDTAINIDKVNPRFAGMLGKGRIDPLSALQAITAKPVLDLFAAIELARSSESESTEQGQAWIAISDAVQVFAIEANGLEPHGAYRLVADGVELGSTAAAASKFPADDFGGLRIEFFNVPGAPNLLPDLLDPVTRIRHVELRDAQGRVVLQNDFRAVGDLAPPGEFIQKEARLSAPGVLTRAIGVARVQAHEVSARLQIEIEKLAADESYQIIVDGIALTTVTAKSGFIRVESATDDDAAPLPPALRPAININRVEVLDSSGQVVLRGSFKIQDGNIGRLR